MKKEITLEERKKIQLEMLIEIDKFCREHNIKYMLAFGTLLGAIRHKGYIPWDDDIDISMPLEDMLRFKKEFKSEKFKYCDVDTEKYYEYAFSRVSCKSTYHKIGIIAKSYGVNIDLYPTIEVSSNIEDNNIIIKKMLSLYKIRNFILLWNGRIMRRLPVPIIGPLRCVVRMYREKLFSLFLCKGGGAFHCIAGPLEKFEVHTWNFNPLEDMVEVDFEGYKFMAPARYDEYLSHRYGDYMELPPEDQRHPYHGGRYFWK